MIAPVRPPSEPQRDDPGLRILFVAPRLWTGGAERQWSILIPALQRRGFDVRLLTLIGEGDLFRELRASGIDCVCAWMTNRFDVAGLRRALSNSTWRPDLVVTRSVNAHAIGAVVARRAKAAQVITEHGSIGVDKRVSRLSPHRQLLVRLVARKAAAVICVSDRQVPGLVRQGFAERSVCVIPNGVPEPRPMRDRDEMRRELGIREGDFVAALVASVRPEKRMDVFIDAVATASKRNGRIRGIIVGDGTDRARVEQLVRASGDAVSMVGYRTDIDEVLNAVDVVCLSSDIEVMPMVVLEAMALGKATVATRVGGTTDLIDHGRTGFLVPAGHPEAMAEMVLELAEDDAQAHRLGEAARQRYLEEFTAEKMAETYARTLRNVSRPTKPRS